MSLLLLRRERRKVILTVVGAYRNFKLQQERSRP